MNVHLVIDDPETVEKSSFKIISGNSTSTSVAAATSLPSTNKIETWESNGGGNYIAK